MGRRRRRLRRSLHGRRATHQNLSDPNDGLVLAVAALAARILPAALLERDDGARAATASTRPSFGSERF